MPTYIGPIEHLQGKQAEVFPSPGQPGYVKARFHDFDLQLGDPAPFDPAIHQEWRTCLVGRQFVQFLESDFDGKSQP